jgi:choline monooxygenase
VDREAFERSLVRRLLDHLEHRTTDLADEVMELPTEVYSAAHHEREVEVLFRGQPLVFCLSGALPGPETFRTVDLCGTPILLTRDGQGRVRALANACRHRGVRVADGAGKAKRFTCPFIVGRLRPGPCPEIEDYLGPGLADELAMLDFAGWEPHGEPHVHQVDANWKVTLDTFRENYHFNFLHRRTLAKYAYGGVLTFDAFGPHLRNCSALRSIDELRGRPEAEWGDASQHFSYQYSLFPNTSLTFDSRHIELWQILPVTADKSEVLHMAYLRPGLSDEERSKAVDMAPWICEKVVDGEDFWVAGRTEPGVRTGLLEEVVFGRNEPAPQHLHRVFAAALEAAAERSAGR